MQARMEKKRLEDRLGQLALRFPASSEIETDGDHVPMDLGQAVQGENPDGLTRATENDVDTTMQEAEFEVDEIGNIVN